MDTEKCTCEKMDDKVNVNGAVGNVVANIEDVSENINDNVGGIEDFNFNVNIKDIISENKDVSARKILEDNISGNINDSSINKKIELGLDENKINDDVTNADKYVNKNAENELGLDESKNVSVVDDKNNARRNSKIELELDENKINDDIDNASKAFEQNFSPSTGNLTSQEKQEIFKIFNARDLLLLLIVGLFIICILDLVLNVRDGYSSVLMIEAVDIIKTLSVAIVGYLFGASKG